MDTVALVEEQIDEGQRLLGRLHDETFVVNAAGWGKPIDEDRWTLFIANPIIAVDGPLVAYRRLTDILRAMGDLEIDSSNIKLIGENHPIARKFMELNRRLTGKPWIHCGPTVIGGIHFEDIYVYSPRFMEVTIYGMIFDGEQPGPLHLSLEPHDPTSRLTVTRSNHRQEYPAKTGLDWVVAAPEGATLERDETGGKTLAWDFRGHREKSSANDVWTFAKLGLHGFRFLKIPAS
jgi:hypothetical protein